MDRNGGIARGPDIDAQVGLKIGGPGDGNMDQFAPLDLILYADPRLKGNAQPAHRQLLGQFDLVGIPNAAERLGHFPHQMSGGQCQRVMIAIAIACNPKLLIADEPTTALDVTIQKQILDLLMKIQVETGMGLIMITHDMAVVAETADRVIVQYKGKKMEEADVLSLFEAPKNAYTKALLSALPENATGDRLTTVSDFMSNAQAAGENA